MGSFRTEEGNKQQLLGTRPDIMKSPYLACPTLHVESTKGPSQYLVFTFKSLIISG
jgi:hypothetical protein